MRNSTILGTWICLILAIGAFPGCTKLNLEPSNGENILGTWGIPSDPLLGCDYFCPQLKITPTEFTVYFPGSLETYACRIQGNQLLTTPSIGSIDFEYEPAVFVIIGTTTETLKIKSNPPNSNIDGTYYRTQQLGLLTFPEMTAWHATNLRGESHLESFLANTIRIALDILSQVSDEQLEGPDPVEPISLGSTCLRASLVRTGTPQDPAGTITIEFLDSYDCRYQAFGFESYGTIKVEYSGKKFEEASMLSIDPSNLVLSIRNSVDGVINLTRIMPIDEHILRYNVASEDGKFSFVELDTTFFTWDRNLEFEWRRNADPALNEWVILAGGIGTGINHFGESYNVTIQEDILYRPCKGWALPLAGKVLFNSNNKTFTFSHPPTPTSECIKIAEVNIGNASGTWRYLGDGGIVR